MAKKVRCTFSITAEIGKKSILEVRWLLPVGIPRSVRDVLWNGRCAPNLSWPPPVPTQLGLRDPCCPFRACSGGAVPAVGHCEVVVG